MAYDHMVSLTRTDGSRRIFHVYGRATPKRDDLITLPIDGRLIKARIVQNIHDARTQVDEVVAIEAAETLREPIHDPTATNRMTPSRRALE